MELKPLDPPAFLLLHKEKPFDSHARPINLSAPVLAAFLAKARTVAVQDYPLH